jgi:hypothetical protein
MKYIKKYNEDINWEWVDEEIGDIDLEYLRKNKIPIKVYKKNWETFVYDVFKQIKLDIRRLNRFSHGNDYIYIWLYDNGYYLEQRSIEIYLNNEEYPHNIDKVVEYK